MKKRLICLTFSFLIIFSSIIHGADALVDFNYSDGVKAGTIRYVSQLPSMDVFYEEYWGRFAPHAPNECGTASISMALSYIGIDQTPEDLGNYWISRGYVYGIPFSTMPNDVPFVTGGETYDFEMAFNRYVNGNGLYSPVIIYFTPQTNPNKTGNRHFVLVTEKNPDGSYNAVNPCDTDLLNLRIDKASGGFNVTVYGKKGTTSGFISQFEFRSAQYFNPNGSKIASPIVEAEKKLPENPDLAFPSSISPSEPTKIAKDMTEIRFSDTGSDSYTLYYRRADREGSCNEFSESLPPVSLDYKVGEGLCVKNDDGTISVFIGGGLEQGYNYRFYISSANGKGSSTSTYGFAE